MHRTLLVTLTNAISVDVEDYFQTEAMSAVAPRSEWESFPARVEASTGALFDLFARFDVKGTFFFLGWVAEHFPHLVRQAHELGHEVGCHSYWHHPVFRLSSQDFWEDTYRARSAIEDATGAPVIGYRAPNFSINESVPWAYPILEELGFRYDSSVYPVRHELYGNHHAARSPYLVGANLMEIPLATWRVFNQNLPVAGGAYLRILPYALVKNGVRAINRNEQAPAVLYLHPWEIDDSQPRLAASWKSRTRQYTGLAGMKSRLERLLRQFAFGRIDEAVYRPALARMRDGNSPAKQPAPGDNLPETQASAG
ncbi:MAG: XrtA system polysaccharide deacetylase [Candidatus Korobacteraceae bacterium]